MQKKHAKKIARHRKFIHWVSQSCKQSGSNAFLKFFPKLLLRCLSRVYTLAHMNAKLDVIMQEYNGSSSKYLCSMCSHYSYDKQCMNKDVYGVPELVKFEDRQYFAPAQRAEYLKKIYGDYMRMPTQEEIDRQIRGYFGDKFI